MCLSRWQWTEHTFHLDLNGVPLEPEREQLPGSCRDWYGIQRWAEVGNDEVSVTVAPLDSPLMQVGGITTGRWAQELDTSSAMLVSWALHNHWDTNFKASQGEAILQRYRLTSRALATIRPLRHASRWMPACRR